MKHGWRTFMGKYGSQFPKCKRKDLVYWFWRMLQWACRPTPRITPPRRNPQHHPQHLQNQHGLIEHPPAQHLGGNFNERRRGFCRCVYTSTRICRS
jgi:hypothetical protein